MSSQNEGHCHIRSYLLFCLFSQIIPRLISIRIESPSGWHWGRFISIGIRFIKEKGQFMSLMVKLVHWPSYVREETSSKISVSEFNPWKGKNGHKYLL